MRLDFLGDLCEDSCGVDADCESNAWSRAPATTDAYVLPSLVEELLSDGSGSVDVSSVPDVTDLSVSSPSWVSVRCFGVGDGIT